MVMSLADRVSVIIPCYNCEKMVRNCLDSVLAQTFPTGQIEIILINDASTDNTPDILRQYEELNSERILLVNCEKNAGQGHARNLGLSYATGKYIAFVDADDRVEAEYVSQMHERIIRHDCDMVICGYLMEQNGTVEKAGPAEEEYYDLRDPDQKKRFLILQGMRNAPWGKLFKASFLKENSILFPENVKMEDIYFHELTLFTADSCFCIPNCLYHYIVNENGTMFSPRIKDYFMDIFYVKKAAYERLHEEGRVNGFEDEMTFLFYVKGFVETLKYLLSGLYGIEQDTEKVLMLKNYMLKTFPDILSNPYILMDQSEYNRMFLNFLAER